MLMSHSGGFYVRTQLKVTCFSKIQFVTSSRIINCSTCELIIYKIGYVCLHKLSALVLGHNYHLVVYGTIGKQKKYRAKWYCLYGSSHSRVDNSLLLILHHAHRSIETLMSIVVIGYKGIQACWLQLSIAINGEKLLQLPVVTLQISLTHQKAPIRQYKKQI